MQGAQLKNITTIGLLVGLVYIRVNIKIMVKNYSDQKMQLHTILQYQYLCY